MLAFCFQPSFILRAMVDKSKKQKRLAMEESQRLQF